MNVYSVVVALSHLPFIIVGHIYVALRHHQSREFTRCRRQMIISMSLFALCTVDKVMSLSVCVSVCLSVCPVNDLMSSVCLSVCLSSQWFDVICLSVCLSVCPVSHCWVITERRTAQHSTCMTTGLLNHRYDTCDCSYDTGVIVLLQVWHRCEHVIAATTLWTTNNLPILIM